MNFQTVIPDLNDLPRGHKRDRRLLDDIATSRLIRPGFDYTANATTQKQSDYKVEQSSFTLIALC